MPRLGPLLPQTSEIRYSHTEDLQKQIDAVQVKGDEMSGTLINLEAKVLKFSVY